MTFGEVLERVAEMPLDQRRRLARRFRRISDRLRDAESVQLGYRDLGGES